MSERDELRDTVARLAEEAGLEKAARAAYPEPTTDAEANAYLRHLADNLTAVTTNRVRAKGLARDLDAEVDPARRSYIERDLHALEVERKHLVEIVGRHGYDPSDEAARARQVMVDTEIISQDEADALEAKSRPSRAKRAPSA